MSYLRLQIRPALRDNMVRVWLLTLFLLPAVSDLATAQSLLPSSPFTSLDGIAPSHKTPTGQPCLTFEGFAKPQIINKTIIEHWVRATNSCGQYVKVQVCYYHTDDCIKMNVPPWDQQEDVLGIYPVLRDFRFEAKEQ
jgi:hypothetical protein